MSDNGKSRPDKLVGNSNDSDFPGLSVIPQPFVTSPAFPVASERCQGGNIELAIGFISCSDDNNFCVDEKKQIIIVHNLMSFKIVRDSPDVVGTREYTIRKANAYSTENSDTIFFNRKTENLSIRAFDSLGVYSQNIIELLPNSKYILTHFGMGGSGYIKQYIWTDSKAKIHTKSNFNEAD